MRVFKSSVTIIAFSGLAFFSEYLQLQISEFIAAGGSDQSLIFWLWIVVLMIFTLLKPLALVLYHWGTGEPSFSSLQWVQINDTLKENVRAIGSILSWSLLLLLPGLIRFFQLWWVPWVTLGSPAYQAGQIDALYGAKIFFKANAKRLLFLILFFEMLVPLLLESLAIEAVYKFFTLGFLQFGFYFCVQRIWNQFQNGSQVLSLK